MPTGSEDGCIVIIVVDTMAQEFITNMSAGRGGCVCEKGGGGRWEGDRRGDGGGRGDGRGDGRGGYNIVMLQLMAILSLF